MTLCLYASDLHGKFSRYEQLMQAILREKPRLLLLGGDLLPHPMLRGPGRMSAELFVTDYLQAQFGRLKSMMGKDYPEVLLIMGNDDPRCYETDLIQGEDRDLWHYLHGRTIQRFDYTFTGYAMVPPTPFLLKDWERYDVSRYVDPGCVPPTEGSRTVEPGADIEYVTMKAEIESLAEGLGMERSVWLFHSPPYQGLLDRAALDGMIVDHVPLDVHVGSIAIRDFIEEKQPYLTLHGHIHESSRITGHWWQETGRTLSVNAAHDGPELSLVSFDLENLATRERKLL